MTQRMEDIWRGALFMLGAAALFAGMGALIKHVSTSIPNEMVVFFRSAFGLVALLPWIWYRGGFRSLRTHQFGKHLSRAFSGLAAMYCYFFAIAHMPLAEATLFNYSTPLFVPFIAYLWLREPVSAGLKVAIAIGFVGILFVIKPGPGLFEPVALVGLASGIFAAVAMVSIRSLSHSEPATRTVFYFTAISSVVSALPLMWAWRTPAPELWVALVAMGFMASGAQLLLTRAYAHARAAQVGPFSYSTPVFAALLAALFWGEIPDLLSAVGAGLVVLGGVLAIRQAGRTAPRG